MSRNKKVDQISDEVVEFNRQQTIRDGLSEIYQDDDGSAIDVKKLQIRPKHGWRWWLVVVLAYLAGLGILAGGAWYWFMGRVDPTAVIFNLSAPKSLVAGQEFEYVLDYKNQDRSGLKNLYIKIEYPQNFIFLSAEPAAATGTAEWKFDNLPAGGQGQIKIKGKIINEVGKSNVAVAEMYYSPEGFSSEYKKVASFDSAIDSLGLETVLVRDSSALVGEAQKMVFKYKLKDNGLLKHFWLTLEPSDISQVEFINNENPLTGAKMIKPWIWEIDGADTSDKELPINFKFVDKTADKYQFQLKLETKEPLALDSLNGTPAPIPATTTATSSADLLPSQTQDLVFYQETVEYEVVNNDLNLSLIMNGSDQEQSINFGQTLTYTLSYANKGSKPINDVVVMAVVEGDIIDWSSFKDKFKGQVGERTITWTKNELPALASLAPGDKGMIDFSLKIKDFAKIKGKAFGQEITSYGKFAAKTDTSAPDNANKANDNKSNTIVGRLNSDLLFEESLLYFSDDNIPLGSGPIPFTVGEKTVVRGSWKLMSSLHDLNNIEVSLKLPDYVDWGDKSKLSAGSLNYDAGSRTISWRLGQLGAGQDAATAEFDLAVNPTDKQRRQLLVIMPKAKITAMDSVTNSPLAKEGKVKTSKLEDDNLINSGDLDNNGGLVK